MASPKKAESTDVRLRTVCDQPDPDAFLAFKTRVPSARKFAEKTGEEALSAFEKAIENVKPRVEVKSRRVGGANYQVPVDVRPERQVSLALRWLITYARARGEKGMVAKLSAELIDAFNNRGGSVKKREDTHRMAEANKAFAHFRW